MFLFYADRHFVDRVMTTHSPYVVIRALILIFMSFYFSSSHRCRSDALHPQSFPLIHFYRWFICCVLFGFSQPFILHHPPCHIVSTYHSSYWPCAVSISSGFSHLRPFAVSLRSSLLQSFVSHPDVSFVLMFLICYYLSTSHYARFLTHLRCFVTNFFSYPPLDYLFSFWTDLTPSCPLLDMQGNRRPWTLC